VPGLPLLEELPLLAASSPHADRRKPGTHHTDKISGREERLGEGKHPLRGVLMLKMLMLSRKWLAKCKTTTMLCGPRTHGILAQAHT